MKELLLDTNVFIRFLIKNGSAVQFNSARRIFEDLEKEKTRGFISLLVLNETVWVLEHYYRLKREIYLPKLLDLLALEQMKIIETKKSLVVKVLQKMLRLKFDMTDIYLKEIKGKREILSFDKDFEKI